MKFMPKLEQLDQRDNPSTLDPLYIDPITGLPVYTTPVAVDPQVNPDPPPSIPQAETQSNQILPTPPLLDPISDPFVPKN